ncbi:hypothetical protein TVAG_209400 [Trichomonas vaginalis G3]|uniref:Uncharacterized protein n=1 Tax=Trichomonas vaginalis (strain ATCC PRA-98 / G3) TaxID=412133 RepID=A2G2X6_TRIV3|nr:hypothetical protein TVAGG3_0209430 [Trichomonas vaginalis G3]EAX88489.1 hypothetical protein TVAG_209400 [Trichomonas vaginalis G3]KAI5551132.1 hypothetical protein TVAGG3_0209430 [Trichomonas vaginalis G3]|eukprot:XP_001301419.1 hypothetical protein [Trichomonas vaginalis G3]
MAAKREVKIKIPDPQKQTAKKTGPPATPRELLLATRVREMTALLEKQEITIADLKESQKKVKEQVRKNQEYIRYLERNNGSYANRISDLIYEKQCLGDQADNWHSRCLYAEACLQQLKKCIRNLANDL